MKTTTIAQKRYSAAVLSSLILLIALLISSCGGPSSDDGEVITEIILPTDTLLALNCPDVGINDETCILQDPDNPFRTVPVREFNVNDPDAKTKFDLNAEIAAAEQTLGRKLSKARFYLWATALARFPSGENQYYTAFYLHELLDEQIKEFSDPDYDGDPIIREQALRAYRSVLDNYFGSVTFFVFSYLVNGQVIFSETGPPPNFDPDRGDRPLPVSAVLNELVADNLYRQAATGFVLLVPGDPVLRLNLISEWGYTYQPCTDTNCTNGVITVSEFP